MNFIRECILFVKIDCPIPGTSLIAQLVKNLPEMQETPFLVLDREIHWRRDRLSTPVFLGFPCDSVGKESTCNAQDMGSIPGSRYPLEKG